MAYTPTDPRDSSTTSAPRVDEEAHDWHPDGAPDADHAAGDRPRLLEEHPVNGQRGIDLEATDDRGRRWYHLRPDPRMRYDMFGFNYSWWLIWIVFVLIVFLPWGRGWGY